MESITTVPLATFDRLWRDAVEVNPDRQFLIFLDETGTTSSWTYREFDRVVQRLCATLHAHGVSRGDAVHLVLRNCPAFVGLWLAAARIGAWIVPADPSATTRDLAVQIRRTQPVVAVVGRHKRYTYPRAEPVNPVLIEIAEDAGDLQDASPLHSEPIPTQSIDAPAPDDRLAVMFTSGTTSAPKGAVLTQGCYYDVGVRMAARLRPEHRWFVTLPLFHANAQYYCFTPAIAVGASVAMTAVFSASRWVEQARTLEVTHASLFAAPIRMILARTPEQAAPLKLQHVWFAQNLGRRHHAAFSALVGTAPRQLYGMTETVAIVTYDHREPAGHDVIGEPADRDIRIVDPTDSEAVDDAQVGELLVRGIRGRSLFAGYLDDPQRTSTVFNDQPDGTSWFRTGDLVRRDSAGIRFVGRIDDIIKVAGENVSLTDVEAISAQAPGVLEVAVIAQPDAVRDMVPVAFFVPTDAANPPTDASLREWATANLSAAARPRAWTPVEELPRSSVGKVRRVQLTTEVQP